MPTPYFVIAKRDNLAFEPSGKRIAKSEKPTLLKRQRRYPTWASASFLIPYSATLISLISAHLEMLPAALQPGQIAASGVYPSSAFPVVYAYG